MGHVRASELEPYLRLAWWPCPRDGSPVKVWSDCSVLESVTAALRLMVLANRVQLEFCCEKDLSCRNILEKIHEPKHMYHDILGRDVASMPEVDLYTAGFPCQPLSRSGLRQGRRDEQGRGNIFDYVAEYIDHKLPKVCLLENVASLTWKCHHEAFQAMLVTLRRSDKYFITWRLLNAADFGIP